MDMGHKSVFWTKLEHDFKAKIPDYFTNVPHTSNVSY